MLDRLWLTAIAIAALVMIPIWLILSAERMGWPFVIICVTLALVYRSTYRT